ncbi:MAG TPA: response regulator transcription factor [Chitinophagaceae bacterium]|nr:response regulator transcription factor [Chitinophagaceae bacterium]
MNNAPVKIILVDDHNIIRNLYKKIFESSLLFTVIADFDDSEKAIEEIKNFNPDIILVDINMSPVNGFYVTEQLLKQNATLKIIGLSINNLPSYARRIIELGARGYLTKTSPIDEVLDGIMEVYKGNTYICAEVRNKQTP